MVARARSLDRGVRLRKRDLNPNLVTERQILVPDASLAGVVELTETRTALSPRPGSGVRSNNARRVRREYADPTGERATMPKRAKVKPAKVSKSAKRHGCKEYRNGKHRTLVARY